MIRVRPEHIQPLELWDLLLPDGSILWDHTRAPDFGSLLCGAITGLWNGSAVSRSDGPVSLAPWSFDVVHLTGGGAWNALAGMRGGPWSHTTLGGETVFSAAAGGAALLAGRHLTGWVLDVGQTALKLCAGPVRLQKARDWQRLPLRDDERGAQVRGQRDEMRRFLATFFHEMHEAVHAWPAALVAALPCRLNQDGVPEGSSYAGMQGDTALLPDAMRMAGMPEMPLLVLNDAELAALSACEEAAVTPPTLVLTLGFGVGAALIHP